MNDYQIASHHSFPTKTGRCGDSSTWFFTFMDFLIKWYVHHFFSTLINGVPTRGWVQSRRGVRQDYPLAFVIFGIVVDALAQCTFSYHEASFISTVGQGTLVHLLQSAADTNYFIEGSTPVARTISILIDLLSDSSGLGINTVKSSFVPFGMVEEVPQRRSLELGTAVGSLPLTYLGLLLSESQILTHE